MRACAKDPHAVPQLAPSDIDVRSPSCGLEMGSLASIDRFVDELASQGVLLDGLINNAGMVPISGGVTAEGFEPAFGINYLGTAHLTLELHRRGLLKPDATIVNVTSEEHRLASFASVLDAPLPSTHQGERRLDAHLGALPVDASVFNAMERYAFSKLLLTTTRWNVTRSRSCCSPPFHTSSRGASRARSRTSARARSRRRLHEMHPGLSSEIARDAPWPLVGDCARCTLASRRRLREMHHGLSSEIARDSPWPLVGDCARCTLASRRPDARRHVAHVPFAL